MTIVIISIITIIIIIRGYSTHYRTRAQLFVLSFVHQGINRV